MLAEPERLRQFVEVFDWATKEIRASQASGGIPSGALAYALILGHDRSPAPMGGIWVNPTTAARIRALWPMKGDRAGERLLYSVRMSGVEPSHGRGPWLGQVALIAVWAHSTPLSTSDVYRPSNPTTSESTSATPTWSPAALSCFETDTSARLGSRFPDGWLWATSTLRTSHSRRNRNTSRGEATEASTVPTWQTPSRARRRGRPPGRTHRASRSTDARRRPASGSEWSRDPARGLGGR